MRVDDAVVVVVVVVVAGRRIERSQQSTNEMVKRKVRFRRHDMVNE
jgi:hypothetical protein